MHDTASREHEEDVELVADRFAISHSRVVDLATGDPIVLTITSAGGPHDQRRWAVRCDALMKLHHRSMATLVDYGEIGETKRFEAWRCGPSWAGSHAAADLAVRRVGAFLSACRLSGGVADQTNVRQSAYGAVVLPDAAAGYPLSGDVKIASTKRAVSVDDCGFAVQPRQAVAALAELFTVTNDARPQIAAIWGTPGAGTTTAVVELARLARLRGFVPVAARVLDNAALRDVLAGRTLFLIADDFADGWRTLLTAMVRTPRPHVLIFAGAEEVSGVNGIPLDRLTVSALVSSVEPRQLRNDAAVRVRRAAARANGLPGRFVQMLWPPVRSVFLPRRSGRPLLRAAEQPAIYGIAETVENAATAESAETGENAKTISPVPSRSWPAPGELAGLRRRIGTACDLIGRGRHAPAERLLRQAIGGLARRGDWPQAGRGALVLASFLVKRGRARDALAAIEEATNYWNRAGDRAALVESATVAGSAWIDLGRLSDAEPVLAGALAAARSSGNGAATAWGVLALARCMFWQGRYAEADQLLASTGWDDDKWTIRAGILQSRIAVGLHDFGRAISTVTASSEAARKNGDSDVAAAAAWSAAFVHLAAGDLDACERDAAECLMNARRVHDPLRAIRARLLQAESARRRERRSAASLLVRRLDALSGTMLPPIVRARVSLIKALIGGDSSDEAVVGRHVASTGLPALALFAPFAAPAGRAPQQPIAALDDLLEILRLCQNAEDERTVLTAVCGRLRNQLHAAAVGFVGREGGRSVSIASEGARLDTAIAERAIEAGIAIEPHRCGDRIEASVPVKFGGATIGAVAVRWSLGSTHDRSAATGALSTAATAAAPMLAAALAHGARPTPAGVPELIGASAAIGDVRLAIERAARAPFSVLIEGESGSGKELVARALHRCGSRRDRPFCTLNCAALPDDLVEAELFGHSRGAFTGAVAERPGVFEEAHGGSLFLDEIGELSPRAQAKVLRVIQEGELRRIGENISRRVDVRIVAATNRDLRAETAASRFRMDLLYRLDVIRIVVPPLRERREDIAPIAEHFWRESAARVGSRATLSTATIASLARYDWPGNVRELQNVLAALAVRAPKRGVVPPTALPPQLTESRTAQAWRLDEARRIFEERFVRAALVRAGGHRSRAASELGVTRQGLTKLMMRLGIE